MPHRRRGLVLIVSERADTRALYRIVLERAGCRCVTAHDAQAAMACLGGKQVGTAVLDLDLPRLEDGLALAWRLRALPVSPPLIAVTGELRQRLPRGLFRGYAHKPVHPDDLVAAVSEVVTLEPALAGQSRD
jgi:DNA-binding response OmpR family regulator